MASSSIRVPTEWATVAEGLAPTSLVADTLLRLIHMVAQDDRWTGACHLVSAALTVLLREQGHAAVLCIGQVGDLRMGSGAFDHSWVELDDAIYDVAILRPFDASYALAPVVSSHHLDSRTRTGLIYGVSTNHPPDPGASLVMMLGFQRFMDGAPFPVWKMIAEHATALQLPRTDHADLRRRHRDLTWTRRAPYDRS
jgi:hypothetical protein